MLHPKEWVSGEDLLLRGSKCAFMSKPVSGKSTKVWSLVRPAEVWGKHEVLRFNDQNFALTDDNNKHVQGTCRELSCCLLKSEAPGDRLRADEKFTGLRYF